VTGNADTATLAARITVVDSTDATSSIAMFDSATGDLAIKTDGALTYDATTGALTATSFVGTLTGGAAAGSLTGATLAAGVTASSLTSLGTIASLVATTADINAGTFDGVVGGTTPADGSFTTLSASGNASLGTVDSGTWNGDEIDVAYLPAASVTAEGTIEIATAAETTTGTDATRAVSPDGLAGSQYGKRDVVAYCVEGTTDVATGDGAAYFTIGAALDGMNLIDCHAKVITAGITGTTDIQIAKNGTNMLSTAITIDSTETGSETAATPFVIDAAQDDVSKYDLIRIDVDAVSSGTAPKGLIILLTFQKP
jgi:hypothetical protein